MDVQEIREMHAIPMPITLYRAGGWIYGIRYSAAEPPAGCSNDGSMVDDFWPLKRALRSGRGCGSFASGRYRVVLSEEAPLDVLQLEKCRDMGLVRAAAEPVESEA